MLAQLHLCERRVRTPGARASGTVSAGARCSRESNRPRPGRLGTPVLEKKVSRKIGMKSKGRRGSSSLSFCSLPQ